ncbi:MAG TPA: aryl-sulfate sulfotransferase [Dehalococcoidia bacterium]|nr:aryl-sulfate sulfotransferase [Dehalococcoidia bacterium]
MGWPAKQHTGLTFHDTERSVSGYTLVTPMSGDGSYLIDIEGRIVHRWQFGGFVSGYGKLLPSGNLLVRGTDATEEVPDDIVLPMPRDRARHGALREVDWDGNVVWEYVHPWVHHDMLRLDNSNTLLGRWSVMPEALAQSVQGGRAIPRGSNLMFGDDIVEVDADGNDVWSVSLADLLDPTEDPICPIEGRREWLHLNGIDVTASGDILFSCRNTSRVGLVDRASGELRWKFGDPNTHHQHHPTALPNGNVQIFDNGAHMLAPSPVSRIIEVDPATDEIVWSYYGTPREQFFSGHISGAERLAGDNVLICEGTSGRIFEVTRAGELVWEWVTPFLDPSAIGPTKQIFRAHRYEPSFEGLAGRDLDPGAHREQNVALGLMPDGT